MTAATRARDSGMAAAASRRGADWDRAVIRQAIETMAASGTEFSSNDIRDLLPNVAAPLIGSGFLAAARSGLITRTGSTLATHERGHARRVSTWIKAGVTDAVSHGVSNGVTPPGVQSASPQPGVQPAAPPPQNLHPAESAPQGKAYPSPNPPAALATPSRHSREPSRKSHETLTPAAEQAIRQAHWALQGGVGKNTLTEARRHIRSLLDVLAELTGINGGQDTLL